MNLQFYLEKLKSSEEFRKFKKENPSAFLCSAFFSVDKTGEDNKQHFDFFVPVNNPPLPTQKLPAHSHSQRNNKQLNRKFSYNNPLAEKSNKADFRATNNQAQTGQIFSFQLENNYKKVPLENFGGEIPAEIFADFDFEFREIEGLIQKKMDDGKIKKTLQKILISLQNINGKISLTGTAFISRMGIINFIIDLNNREITHFEEKSIFDMIKVFKK